MKTKLHHHLFFLLCLWPLMSSFTEKNEGLSILIVDPQNSTVLWTGSYTFNFNEHRGAIKLLKGEIEMTGEQITGGSFVLDMTSIENHDMRGDSAARDLEKHLKSSDFFDVAKFPKALFTITKATPVTANAGEPNYEITGNLTLKGVKNTLTFRATSTKVNGELKVSAKLKFDRTRWNVRYDSGKFFSNIGDGAISDAIGLEILLVANGC
ncbi:YceI family protein [Chryseolinea lacunae]|uniref:YceI family protein n=1 Tax=Chryseolinea lacunae TaxID=2801331 RepID=A0ABS1KRJ9_9BACT|nr:YceI family protein [Chryseolinea lacunae]MBL0742081.1 YceI family protein [Chryseolinea lacunae]